MIDPESFKAGFDAGKKAAANEIAAWLREQVDLYEDMFACGCLARIEVADEIETGDLAATIRALPVPEVERAEDWPDDSFVERVCMEMFAIADDATRANMKAALRAARWQP